MFKQLMMAAVATAALTTVSFGIPDDTKMIHLVTSDFSGSGGTRVLSPDTGYYLENCVVVPAGWTLRIKPGTKVYGAFSAQDVRYTSTLIISPNAILLAEGTVDSPIVFTTLRDDPRDAGDFGPGAKGLWGGIIWCGEAPISDPTGVRYPEGIPEDLSGVYYGGSRTHYYGGKMKYVSIRHGGCAQASASETNALSMYALGDSTAVSYVEAFANSDDGFEFFGGTVNTKNMSATFCNDDQFDLDEGYRGKNQFWFALHQEYEGDRGGEYDGKLNATHMFVSAPTIYNFTFAGSGASPNSGAKGIVLRDSVGGTYCNGIIMDYASKGVHRTTQSDGGGYNVLAKPYGNSGDSIRFQGNMFWNNNDNTWTGTVSPSSDVTYLQNNSNTIANPALRGINRRICGHPRLDPRPKTTSPALSGYVALPSGSFWTTANYRGAFSTTNLWLSTWTALEELGLLGKLVTISPGTCSDIGASVLPMRISFFVKQPGAQINPGNPLLLITMDGIDVTSTFVNKVLSGSSYNLAGGGICYFVEYSQALSFIPSTSPNPVVGPHTLAIEFPLSTGELVKNNMTFSILQ